ASPEKERTVPRREIPDPDLRRPRLGQAGPGTLGEAGGAMTRLIIGAALLVVAGTASAQDPFTNAKRLANKAAAATNAHIEAEQRPDGQSAGQPHAQQHAARDARSSARAPQAPVGTLAVAEKDTTPSTTIMRETYDYSAAGRRDPFISLLTTNELRPSMSDLR